MTSQLLKEISFHKRWTNAVSKLNGKILLHSVSCHSRIWINFTKIKNTALTVCACTFCSSYWVRRILMLKTTKTNFIGKRGIEKTSVESKAVLQVELSHNPLLQPLKINYSHLLKTKFV